MAKRMRTAQAYTQEAVKAAESMKHEDYKAIKHMGKVELVAYLGRIYQRGFNEGARAGALKAREELTGKKPTVLDAPDADTGPTPSPAPAKAKEGKEA